MMDKIPSFTINHLLLERGIFVSRKDITPGGDVLTTFDIRLKRPNREPAASAESLHAMEHLAATFLRNDPEWKERIIYWGPMGCLTGNYLIVSGDCTSVDVLPLMRRTMEFIASFDGEIPGATPRDCGNYSFMDLAAAKKEAETFLTEVLLNPEKENLNYPTGE